VKIRMEGDAGISFTEFAYMLLQANDYRWLHQHRGVELQVGGSDQWGNILSGVDLIRRSSGAAVHALCWPLITAPDGQKLGKSTGGRVWLDPERTSPYQFFQHWMAVDDRQVSEMLAKFTFLPVDEVEAVAASHADAPERRAGQRRLAWEVTALVHGAAAADGAAGASALLFGGDVADADEATFEVLAREVPTVEIARERFDTGVDLLDLLVDAGVCASKGEARRLADQGGVSVNGAKAAAGDVVGADALLHGRFVLLRRGKSGFHLARVDAGGRSL
jgi:tyrosyl-tRNA synthetase